MLPPKPVKLKGAGVAEDAHEAVEEVVAAGKKAGKAVRKKAYAVCIQAEKKLELS